MSDYQLIVIGAGPGGYTAALHAAQAGLRTAIIERREVGGTCLNRGCIPTKTLLHSSQIVSSIREGAPFGVSAEKIHFDMDAIFQRKRDVSAKLRGGIEGMLKAAKVDLLRGSGTVLGTGRLLLREDGGERELTADHILAATGSAPARPPIPGLELEGVVTSDELLEGCSHLYDSIVIIGGGVIGVEFATFYQQLGCRVTLIEGADRLMPTLEREIGQNLGMIMKKRGVTVHTHSTVTNVERSETGLRVNFRCKDESLCAEGECVLCAIGRKPYTEGLFAEGLAPRFDGARLAVNDRYETSIPGVYAIGDVSANVPLAHVAAAQGTDCVDLLCGKSGGSVEINTIPSGIYCVPEIACVGLTADEAKSASRRVAVGKYVLFSNGRTVIHEGERAFMKVVADCETHEIVGAQLMCDHATDMISELSCAIVNHLTVEQMLRIMRPHPTFEEGLSEALEDLLRRLNKSI